MVGVIDGVLIREAVASDVPAMIELERRSDLASHWREEDYLRIFTDGPPARLALVAQQGGVIGFIVTARVGSEWEIENVVVAPEIRRRGIARGLMDQVLERARGHRGVSIFLEVRESNEAARELYRSCGFVMIGKRPGYYSGPDEDAWVYKKTL